MKADLKEKQVAQQISDFMEYRQWRRLRMQSVVFTNPRGGVHRAGEKGMADLLFIRYLRKKPPWAMMLWVETKRNRGGRLSEDQVKWQAEELLRGGVVVNANNFEEFVDWYNEGFGWIHGARGPDVPGNLQLFSTDTS